MEFCCACPSSKVCSGGHLELLAAAASVLERADHSEWGPSKHPLSFPSAPNVLPKSSPEPRNERGLGKNRWQKHRDPRHCLNHPYQTGGAAASAAGIGAVQRRLGLWQPRLGDRVGLYCSPRANCHWSPDPLSVQTMQRPLWARPGSWNLMFLSIKPLAVSRPEHCRLHTYDS